MSWDVINFIHQYIFIYLIYLLKFLIYSFASILLSWKYLNIVVLMPCWINTKVSVFYRSGVVEVTLGLFILEKVDRTWFEAFWPGDLFSEKVSTAFNFYFRNCSLQVSDVNFNNCMRGNDLFLLGCQIHQREVLLVFYNSSVNVFLIFAYVSFLIPNLVHFCSSFFLFI